MVNTIEECYNDFIEKYNIYNEMLADGTVLYQQNIEIDGHKYSKRMYDAVVEHCFMQIYLGWEKFLENSFILYLKSEVDLQGNTYTRYAIPNNSEHAYNMIKGTRKYPDWTNLSEVRYLANVYFEDGGPYSIITNISVEFDDIKVIRNRIAHVSEKSIKAFQRLLSKTIIQTVNVSIGDFLMMFRDNSQTYFTYYMEFLKGNVEAICNKAM